MTSTVAGLPKYVVLKSKSTGKYLHYLWNDEFSDYYKHMGSKRDVDPVNPFVKLEVVPSTADPTLVHLICSYNSKFIQLVSKGGVSWLSATADSPDEDLTKETSTLFQPIFPAGEPNTVEFLHVQTNRNVRIFINKDYGDSINNVACAYSKDGGGDINRFEFAAWVSYEDVIKAKDDEIEKLKAQAAAGDDDESLSADAIVEELRKDIREQNEQLEAAYNEIDALKAAAKAK
uniref:Amaranthin-like lectin n=1 Tax=Linum usitatissimum TaxID=4006 RepID=A0A097PIE0_LINUS|nr:amaranthin-like lectin [Linum usitatissimum]